MMMAAMRLNIPSVFVSGGPMEAGTLQGRKYDLIDAMVMAADNSIPDQQLLKLKEMPAQLVAPVQVCLLQIP